MTTVIDLMTIAGAEIAAEAAAAAVAGAAEVRPMMAIVLPLRLFVVNLH